MVQKARPASDITVGQWTPTPLWERINEEVPDGNGVTSADGVSPDIFEVKLQGMAVPDSRAAGTHKLKVQMQRTGSVPTDVALALMQGSSTIAAKMLQPGTSWGDAGFDLTEAEAGLITDYADLRVRVIAGRVTVPCCPGSLPPLLYVTLSEATNDCGCVMGTYMLLWVGGSWDWIGTMCGKGADINLSCQDTGGLQAWSMVGITAQHAYEWTCSPLVIDYGQRVLDSTLCTGSARIMVTEEEP